MSEPIQACAKQVINDFYEDLEVTILSCMAAGVPASKFIVTKPELTFQVFVATMQCHIGFKWGEL